MEEINWLYIFLSPFELVTIPLYIRIVYVLLTDKLFHQPFYRLICVIGIVDIVHFCTEFCFYRLAYIPFFIDIFGTFQKGRWIAWITALIFGCTYVQLLLHLAISLNRFTGLRWPFLHRKYWRRYWPWVVLAFFSAAIGLCSDRLFFGFGQFAPMISGQPDKGLIPSVVEYQYYQFDQSLFTVVLGTFCCSACLCLNLTTLLLIWHAKKQNQMPMLRQTNVKIELNLFLIALFMMVPQFVLISFHIILRLFLNNQMFGQFLTSGTNKTLVLYQMMEQNAWLDDLYSLTQPWIIILVCSEVRKSALGPLFPSLFGHKNGQFTTKILNMTSQHNIGNGNGWRRKDTKKANEVGEAIITISH